MRIVTWASATDGAVARIEVMTPATEKRPAKLDWLPVVIHGRDETVARAKALIFYRTEQERFAALEAGRSSRLEKMAAARRAKAELDAAS